MKYSWILFDADNTLFDFTYSQRKALEQTFGKFSLDYSDNVFDDFVKINIEIWTAYDRNEITHEEIKYLRFKRLFDVYVISEVDHRQFNTYFINKLISNSKLLDGAENLLLSLHGKTKIALITNGMKEVQRPRFEQCRLKYVFDQVFISGEIGKSKPNYEFFEYVHNNCNNEIKNNYLVVGDNLIADIEGGKNFGFDTCWYNINNEDIQEIEHADFVVNTLDELKQILENQN